MNSEPPRRCSSPPASRSPAPATAEPPARRRASASEPKVLKRAFAAPVERTSIVHLRMRTDAPGMAFTDDVWMHVGAAGFVDKVRELRVDGTYAGLESVHDQPNGLGDPTGAVGRKRENASDRSARTRASATATSPSAA